MIFATFSPAHYSNYLYRDIWILGSVIKEGIILVISIVTLQNYYGDLGEVCGKYPGWGKVPGPFDICHFSPSSLFYVRILRHIGFGGHVIKECLILVISIVTLQNYIGHLGDVCSKYPGWVKVPGPFDICHFFTQLTILFTYIETYGFWGPVITEGIILAISIVTLQNKFGDPAWVNVPGPFDIFHFFTQLTILFTYIETYGFLGSRYNRRFNFSYIDYYTPKL